LLSGKPPPLFKSFAGLTVQEFGNIHDKEIAKRYERSELKHLSLKRKDNIKRKIGAGSRHFKLTLKVRFVMPAGTNAVNRESAKRKYIF